MDEASLEASLEEYKGQVTQMELAISVTEDEPTKQELIKLKDEIMQLVQLTEGTFICTPVTLWFKNLNFANSKFPRCNDSNVNICAKGDGH